MQFWNEIINTALLGTEKKPVAIATLPTPLQEAAAIIGGQPGTDKEEQFLQLAAVSLNFRQSGIKPLHQPALTLPEAAAEAFPYCSPRATQVLKDLLAEDNRALIAFWLEHCVAAQKLAPPELVPTLLNLAVNDRKGIQQGVTAVCGRRGEWLSRLNPAWEFSAVVDEEQLWQTGTLDQRKLVLWRMRQQDPSKARDWLLQAWPQENANTRAELLKQLDGTVQPEDDPFLMPQQNEKSQKVKEEAIRLLQQLPGSTLVKKYQELLQPLITLKKEKALLGMITKTTLQIQLPDVPEKGSFAPGIEKLSNVKGFTDGEFILYQLIQSVPPAFWEGHFALSPDAILGYFSSSYEKYRPAFIKAAGRFSDKKWAAVYLEHRDEVYPELLDLLPPAQREAYAIRIFGQSPDLVIQHARQWAGEWSFELAKLIVGYAANHENQYTFADFHRTNIQRIPVALAPLVEDLGPAEKPWRTHWLYLASLITKLLELKQQTLNAFNE